MRILIAGGGIGGLTAALALTEAGFAVDLYERAPAFGEVGAGIQLGPNAMQVLQRLGLGEAIGACAFRPERLEMRDGASGLTIFTLPMGEAGEARYGAPYVHIHRADLIGLLAQALQARAGDAIHLGTGIVRAHSTDTGAIAELERGHSVRADALIGADGVHSAVRESLFPDAPARYTGFAAWRLTVEASEPLKALIPPAATVWTGPDRHAVTYYLRAGRLINFVGVVARPDWTAEGWSEPGEMADLRRDFAAFAAPVRAVLEAGSEAFIWALRDRPALPRWSVGHLTLLGDAAHAMPPFMAQGAGQAIEDAWVLSRALRAMPDRPREALARYESLRHGRASAVQSAAWRNLKVFHRRGGALGLGLRLGLRAASTLAPDLIRAQSDWIYRWKAGETV